MTPTAMSIILSISALTIITAAAVLSGCASKNANPADDPALEPLWSIWESGNIEEAERRAKPPAIQSETHNQAAFILTLVSHVKGKYSESIEYFNEVEAGYPYIRLLYEPVLWSYIHSGRYEEAYAFAKKHSMGTVAQKRIRRAVDHPMSVSADTTQIIPFSDDALTPVMPGFAVSVNGHPQTARLDTGGSYIHVTVETARLLGIQPSGVRERAFAGLALSKLDYANADLSIGNIELKNVPVIIHSSGLPAQQLSKMFGVELGPVIGTNVLQQFLTTVDPLNGRLILSPRGNDEERSRHFALLGAQGTAVPFYMLNSHFLLAKGNVDGRKKPLFIDSGLVVIDGDGKQASFLASSGRLASWNASRDTEDGFPVVSGSAGIEGLELPNRIAYPVPVQMWQQFGDWNGLDVEALLSWGYLKDYIWTLDFENRQFYFIR